MRYLEDNALILDDLRGQLSEPPDEQFLRSGNTMRTYMAGNYYLPSIGIELPVALKLFKRGVRADAVTKFCHSLGTIDVLADNPDLSPMLPLCYGQLLDPSGQPIGQVAEDFSEGGKLWVRDFPYFYMQRPDEVNELSRYITGYLEALLNDWPQLPGIKVAVDEDYGWRCQLKLRDMGLG